MTSATPFHHVSIIKFYLKPRKPHNSSEIIISVVHTCENCQIDMFFTYKHFYRYKAGGHHSHFTKNIYLSQFIFYDPWKLDCCVKKHVTWNVLLWQERCLLFVECWKKGLKCARDVDKMFIGIWINLNYVILIAIEIKLFLLEWFLKCFVKRN